MKFKQLLFVFPAAMLFACGGGEESTDDNHDSTEESTSDSEESGSTFEATTFETCPATNGLSMTAEELNESNAFAFEKAEGVDFTSFAFQNGEITEKHDILRIKFANSEENLDKNLGDFGPEDMTMTINFKVDGELAAGEYNDDNSDIRLTKGENVDGTMKTGDLGSNKISKTLVLNSVSEDHACGSFSMSDEEGLVIIEGTFDVDLTVSPW